MPPPISIQLYTVRHLSDGNFPALLKEIADIGYLGVEPAGFRELTPRDFKQVVTDLGLEISSAHGALPIGSDANRVLDEQEAIGNRLLISGLGPDAFADAKAIRVAAGKFTEAARNASARGITIGYHNHWWEFDRTIDGKTPYEIFMEEVDPSVFGQIDIYWVQTAGLDPASEIGKLGGRCPILHIKDGPCVQREPMTAVGEGKVDVEGAIRAARAARWHVVELDECATDMLEAVGKSYDFLTSRGLSQGRL